MNPLEVLKERLQKALNDDNEFEGFIEAISDGLYATNLSEIALRQWILSWIDSPTSSYSYEEDYKKGVQFVEEQWHQITGMF